MKIAITGASGFVGVNLTSYLEKNNIVEPLSVRYVKNQEFNFSQDVVIHLSGKAHDIKNAADSKVYQEANFELTKQIYDGFIESDKTTTFIFISSVKAIADSVDGILTEETEPTPKTDYGISKRNAEQYILEKDLPANKRFFILRPCMIHGPENKGNLNLMYNLVVKKIPWPLGNYNNKRSFLCIGNFNFIIKELIINSGLKSNVYNLADDKPLTTNNLVVMIANTLNMRSKILKISKSIINSMAAIGDFSNLPLNTERLRKLTENYIVSNSKIKKDIGKELPFTVEEGLLNTFNSFRKK